MGLFDLIAKRRAEFKLDLVIHDIANVPLVSGSFSTEWKFRSGGKAAHNDRSAAIDLDPSKEKRIRKRSEAGSASTSRHPSLRRSPTSASHESGHSTISQSSSSSSSSTSSRPRKSTKAKEKARDKLHHVLRDEDGNAVERSSKGLTEEVAIKDHGCAWNVRVLSGVSIGVGSGKEAGELGERFLRLIVHQHLGPHETKKMSRLGQLHLNLAEYVGKGRVTRRYLLDEGKTNATLKVSLELTQVGGQTSWNEIPISKGQVAGAGLESLVGGPDASSQPSPFLNSSTSTSSVFGASRHGSTANLHTNQLVPPSSSSPASQSSTSIPSTATDPSRNPPTRPTPTPGSASYNSLLQPTSVYNIIEAIFNPTPSHTVSPFTIPIAPVNGAAGKGEQERERDREEESYGTASEGEGEGELEHEVVLKVEKDASPARRRWGAGARKKEKEKERVDEEEEVVDGGGVKMEGKAGKGKSREEGSTKDRGRLWKSGGRSVVVEG